MDQIIICCFLPCIGSNSNCDCCCKPSYDNSKDSYKYDQISENMTVQEKAKILQQDRQVMTRHNYS